jgi:hypothetical protein
MSLDHFNRALNIALYDERVVVVAPNAMKSDRGATEGKTLLALTRDDQVKEIIPYLERKFPNGFKSL